MQVFVGCREVVVFLEDVISESASLADEFDVGDEVGEAEIGQAGLGGAKEVTGAAKLEVGFGDFETVGGFFEDGEFLDGFGEF